MQEAITLRRATLESPFNFQGAKQKISSSKATHDTITKETLALVHDYILESVWQHRDAGQLHQEILSLVEGCSITIGLVLEIVYQIILSFRGLANGPSAEAGKQAGDRLADLVKRLLENKGDHRIQLIERMDDVLLNDCGMIETKKFETKKNRIMTKNIYEQQKFNLFREESEGYSKLCMELLELKDRYSDKFDQCLQNVISLIGFFDLDINRVIDLIIEFYVYNNGTDLYLKLLHHFKKEFISQILGYKFQKLHASKEGAAKNEGQEKVSKKSNAPVQPQNLKNLAKAAAKLIKHKLVKIDELWPHLEPADQSVSDTYRDNYAIAFEMFKKNYSPKLTVTAEEIEKEKEENVRLEKTIKSQIMNNQKLWLAYALIQENDFIHFEKVIRVLGPYIDFHSFQLLLGAITEYTEWFIEPCYRFLSPSLLSLRQPELAKIAVDQGCEDVELRRPSCDPKEIFKSLENAKSYLEFMVTLDRILGIVKHDLAYSPTLFGKLCRILKYRTHYQETLSSNCKLCTRPSRPILRFLRSQRLSSISGSRSSRST